MNSPNPLGEAPIRSLFFKYYKPTLVSLLSMTFHQVANGIILGQQVGKEGIAAVGLYGPVVTGIVALSLPIMIGGGILISKNIGAGLYDKVQQIFQFATMLAILVGGTIAISTPFIIKPLSEFLAGAKNTILIKNVSDYIFWQLISLPFFFMRMFWGSFIGNDGAPKVGKNASLLAVSLNVALDLILIIGFHMGVKGAAIATAISMFAGTFYLFIYILKDKGHFGFKHFRFSLKLKEWRQLLNYGLPSFASELSFASGLLIINHSIIPYGPLAVSAFGLVNYISFIFIRLFTAAMLASLPIISFNIGAKLPQRVLDIVKFSLTFTIVLGMVVLIIGFTVPTFLINLFSDNESVEFKRLASSALALYFILFIAAGPNYILSAYFQAIGKSTLSILINVLKGLVLIWFFLLILPGYFEMGLSGVWLSRSLGELFTFVLIGCFTLYKREQYYGKQVIVPAIMP